MIFYSAGRWSVAIFFRLQGSVFPKALVWALPAGFNALLIWFFYYEVFQFEGYHATSAVGAIYGSFTFVLGFLVVFRTQQGYARYWEGATLVQQARANLFSATSSLIAFTSQDRALHHAVEEFQHLLVRLMSMLFCVGLQTVADHEEVRFQFFNTDGIDPESLRFLSKHTDKQQRCEIVIQWVQRLVVEMSGKGVICVPAPILTRFFQELSQGSVHIINARNMTNIPFPFPYAQMLSALLMLHWIITPFFFSIVMASALWSSVFSFVSVFAFWGSNYIAAEIESPFGDDPNDLPLHALQKDMNKSLWVLLHPRTQRVPKFVYDKEKHRKWDVVTLDNFNRKSQETQSIFLHSITNSWIKAGSLNKEKFAYEIPPNLSDGVSSANLVDATSCDLDMHPDFCTIQSMPRETEVEEEEDSGSEFDIPDIPRKSSVMQEAGSYESQLAETFKRVGDYLQKVSESCEHLAHPLNALQRQYSMASQNGGMIASGRGPNMASPPSGIEVQSPTSSTAVFADPLQAPRIPKKHRKGHASHDSTEADLRKEGDPQTPRDRSKG